MEEIKSCGFIVFRREPTTSFLLMKHTDRWDLPKGHVDPGETEDQCALRELVEETGIAQTDIQIDDQFRFESKYVVKYKRTGDQEKLKTLVIFLAWLQHDVEIQLTEHPGFEWIDWNPPHQIQKFTIDPLLAQVSSFLETD